jgi:hypothetical protein
VFVLDHCKVKDLVPEEVLPFLPTPEMASWSFRELLSAAGQSLFMIGGTLRGEWQKPEEVPIQAEPVAASASEAFGLMRMIMWILGEAEMAMMATKECNDALLRSQGNILPLIIH